VKYRISTGELETLVDGINFANGVQTHPDKQVENGFKPKNNKLKKQFFWQHK
jgi:hypothetical protein